VSATSGWAANQKESVLITNSWVRMQPLSRPNSAAYMTLENKTQDDIVLKTVTSHSVATIELHSMEHINGMMKMRQIKDIKIPAKGKVELKPGGFHLMLFGIEKPLNNGETIEMVLHFDNGTESTVQAKVKDPDDLMKAQSTQETQTTGSKMNGQ
jgi:copper(I)-binding protein